MSDDKKEPEGPVILSFAMTTREWAKLAASLNTMQLMANTLAQISGKPKPDEVEEILEAGTRFSGMIQDEFDRMGLT